MTLFSFDRFIRQENPSYRFLKSGNNVTVIFTKSTQYYACLNQIIPDWSGAVICWQRARKWEVERRYSQGLDKVIHVYPTNLGLQPFDKVKIIQTKFFSRYAGWIRAFWRKYLIKNTTYWWYEALESWMPTESIKETFKKLTQQQNHEIDFCKKDLQNTLRRKGKAFYPCQWKIRG